MQMVCVCVFRDRQIRRLEPQSKRDKEAISSVIGVPWRLTDGRWTVNMPEVLVDPIPISHLSLAGARIQRERITKQAIDELGATVWCPDCHAIKDGKHAQARCRVRIEGSLRVTPQGSTEKLTNRRREAAGSTSTT